MNNMNPPAYIFNRRTMLRGIGGVAALAAIGSLAACSSSDTPSAGSSGAAASGTSPASGTLKVLGTATYKVDENNPSGVQVDYGNAGGNEDIVSKTAQPGTFDLVVASHLPIDQLATLDRLEAFDVGRLANWAAVLLTFKDSPKIRRNGEIVAIPHHWGFSYNVYDQSKVASPESIDALLAPELKQRIIMPDDAYAVISAFAAFTGAKDYNLLTQEEFQTAIDQLMRVRPQVLTVHQYGEEGQIFGRGEALVGVAESANTVLLAQEAGVDATFNQWGSWSWFMCYMLLKGTENPDAAYAYIDKALSGPAMLASCKKSQAFPATDDAAALGSIDKAFQYVSADEVLAKAPLQSGVPLESGDGVVGWPEWTAAWQTFKG